MRRVHVVLCALRVLLLSASLALANADHARAQDSVPAQGRARGRVVDAQSGAPVPRAELLLLGAGDTLARGRSDGVGAFTVAGTLGKQFTLEVRRLGFLPAVVQWIAHTGDTTLVIPLMPAAHSLDAVAVVERESPPMRLKAFEDRASLKAGGTYITREQIEAWRPRQTSDMMRRVLGVKLVDSSGILLAASSRGQKVDLKSVHLVRSWAPCIMRVAVDGQIKEWGFSMDLVDPNAIHGIEVYNGPASIPSEYSGMRTDAYCGLVMIWTR